MVSSLTALDCFKNEFEGTKHHNYIEQIEKFESFKEFPGVCALVGKGDKKRYFKVGEALLEKIASVFETNVFDEDEIKAFAKEIKEVLEIGGRQEIYSMPTACAPLIEGTTKTLDGYHSHFRIPASEGYCQFAVNMKEGVESKESS